MMTTQMINHFLQLHQPKNFQMHSLEQVKEDINLYTKANRTEFMCFKQEVDTSILTGKLLKLVDQFISFDRNISSTKSYQSYRNLIYPIKSNRFLSSHGCAILLYRSTTWMLIKHIEEKIDTNYKKMQHAVLNQFWKQNLTK